ncbi:MAG: substrate-binding domain-containing protein [Chloroflexota bacterium]
MDDPLIGKKIGQYEILSLVGQGGMAMVYRAHQTTLKRDVAMKVVTSTLTQDPNFMERFNREVEFIAGLEHAHIVPVHEHGKTEDGIIYLTMRYFKGGTLAERIHSGKPLGLSEISTIVNQIGAALDYAHQHGVIHRDIKPSNVLLDGQGNVYLADFGLARMVEPGLTKNLTEADTFLGTPTYIAPEQLEKTKTDERTDLYSFGIVIYEMLAGRPPFIGDSAFSIMRAHVEQIPPLVRQFRPDLSEAVEQVLIKALSKKPEARYQTAGQLAKAFAEAVSGNFTTQKLIPTESSRLSINYLRAHPFAISVIAILLLVVSLTFLNSRGSSIFSGLLKGTPTDVNQIVPTVNETARPDKGEPSDLTLTDSELIAARTALNGSFIGMVACTLATDYHASLAAAVRNRAQELNLPIRIEDAQNDKTQQPVIINRFVAQGAKAIGVCELDSESVGPALMDAQKAGVKIVRLSDIVQGQNSVSITLTNEAMGQAVGAYTAAMVNKTMNGQANVAILDYPDVPSTVIRANAMETALREKAPKVTVVGRYEGGLPENGERTMAAALQQYPEINVIMSINDAGAYGAIKALLNAGKKPEDVKIVSVDAENEARRMIREGQFFVASVDSGGMQSGRSLVDAAAKLLAGSIVPRQILLPGQVVTREALMSPTQAATP